MDNEKIIKYGSLERTKDLELNIMRALDGPRVKQGNYHGQWVCNSLLRQFYDEFDCYRLIIGEEVNFFRSIRALKNDS